MAPDGLVSFDNCQVGVLEETESIGCISYKEFVHAILEAGKAQGQYLVSWKLRRTRSKSWLS